MLVVASMAFTFAKPLDRLSRFSFFPLLFPFLFSFLLTPSSQQCSPPPHRVSPSFFYQFNWPIVVAFGMHDFCCPIGKRGILFSFPLITSLSHMANFPFSVIRPWERMN